MTAERPIPVYVVGPGHSGTGILYRMLALHPEFAWLSQFSGRKGNIPSRRSFPLAPLLDRNVRRLSSHDWRKRHRGLRQKVLARPKEGHAIWDHVIPKGGQTSVETSVGRLRELLGGEMARLGKPFFIAKLPRLYKHIDVLVEAEESSRFIHIVRDGRAMALSQRYKPRRAALDGSKAQAKLEWASGFWMDVIGEVQKHAEHINLSEVRYEDFCQDVHGTIRVLLDFVGAPIAPFPFSACPETLTVTNDKWLSTATPHEIEYLEQRMSPLLERYGYEPMHSNEAG